MTKGENVEEVKKGKITKKKKSMNVVQKFEDNRMDIYNKYQELFGEYNRRFVNKVISSEEEAKELNDMIIKIQEFYYHELYPILEYNLKTSDIARNTVKDFNEWVEFLKKWGAKEMEEVSQAH